MFATNCWLLVKGVSLVVFHLLGTPPALVGLTHPGRQDDAVVTGCSMQSSTTRWLPFLKSSPSLPSVFLNGANLSPKNRWQAPGLPATQLRPRRAWSREVSFCFRAPVWGGGFEGKPQGKHSIWGSYFDTVRCWLHFFLSMGKCGQLS